MSAGKADQFESIDVEALLRKRIQELDSQLRDLTVELEREKGQLAAALRRADATERALADVRALDECTATHHTDTSAPGEAPERRYSCYVNHPAWVRDRRFYGPTPEAARAKAAAWVREQPAEPPDDTCQCGQRYGEYGHDH